MSTDKFTPRLGWSNDREFFFKYTSSSTAETILSNSKLRWSSPLHLNDPFDLQFDLHMEIDEKEVCSSTLEKLWRANYEAEDFTPGNKLGYLINFLRGSFPKMSREEFDSEFTEVIQQSLDNMKNIMPAFQNEIRSLIADSKILCLTESPTNKLMWAHYADSHKGVVFRFRSIPELDSAWGAARPIKYESEMPKLYDNEFFSDLLSGRRIFNPATIMDWLIYTKSTEWNYEKEWRIYAGSGRNSSASFEDIQFHPSELDAIVLGYKMPRGTKIRLAKIANDSYPHAEILEAIPNSRNFELDIVRFNT